MASGDRAALCGLGVRGDVSVYSEFEFNEWKDELRSIAEPGTNTGVEGISLRTP
jgi:hypothetical protein